MTGRQINQGAVKGSQGAPESRDLEGHTVSAQKALQGSPLLEESFLSHFSSTRNNKEISRGRELSSHPILAIVRYEKVEMEIIS